MAKIVHKGMWISVKSLDKEDRKNYLISMTLFFFGALAWGIHIASVGLMGDEPIDIPNINIIRICIVIIWAFAVFYYMKFFNRQDELMQRYHDFVLSWGAIGFLVLGLTASLVSPFFDFKPTFYEFFLAFTGGSIIGGFRFYKKYLSE
ncbi:MAG: hypothetical protein CMQ74_07315 [Gammaproteobacteria bacterium]|nr:hypothetical protein [Gammaproteobacteria bacterium]